MSLIYIYIIDYTLFQSHSSPLTHSLLTHSLTHSLTHREVCALQDSFRDKQTGTCYAYEVSIRHCEVRGMGPRFVSAEVSE